MIFVHLVNGLQALISPLAILYLIVGMVIGMIIGMIPGLGTAVALSMMLPFVYHMQVVPMIALMLGAQAGGYYAASITAITLNTPGAPESYPTTLDGYPMAVRGEGGKALAISATSTLMGAWIASIAFVLLLQTAPALVTTFNAPDYATIVLLALVIVGLIGDIPISKVLISGGFGLMLSFVGSDPVTSIDRFTFGSAALVDGIGIVPFALGVFAITQMVVMYGTGTATSTVKTKVGVRELRDQARDGIIYTLRHPVAVIRSAILASLLGLLPGMGGFVSNYISYSVGQRLSKKGSQFGSGIPEGIMSAEGSSLAKEIGSLLPAVALGLPSGIGMVLFIAAMTIAGLSPGLELLKTNPSLPYTMMWVMAITALLSCTIGLVLSPWLNRVTHVRGPVMFPFIVGLAILGSYIAVVNVAGIIELMFFAIIGILARKLNYSVAGMAIGLVLGGTFNNNVHVTIETGGLSFILKNPIADVALLAAIVIVLIKGISSIRKSLATRLAVTSQSTKAFDNQESYQKRCRHTSIELVIDIVVFLGSGWYFVVALGYPTAAGIIPAGTSGLVMVTSLVRLVTDMGARVRLARLAISDFEEESTQISEPLGQSFDDASLGTPRGFDSGGATLAEQKTDFSEETLLVQQSASRSKLLILGGSIGGREIVAILWVVIFVICVFLFGFQLGLPVAGVLYSLFAVRHRSMLYRAIFLVASAGFLAIVAELFVSVFNLLFTGLLVH